MMLRKSTVAGQFYSGTEEALKNEIKKYIVSSRKKIKAKGIVSPHAGYMYSGEVAGNVYSGIEIPERVIILCPNHTGMGKPIAIMDKGAWATPLGEVNIDEDLTNAIISKNSIFEVDILAHSSEHSLEVQLPFIQYFKSDFSFVPICISMGSLDNLVKVGETIAEVIKECNEDILIVASSDMTHFESQEQAKKKDKEAIDAILKLDERLLLDKVKSLSISMCGYAPTISTIVACKKLGAKQVNLIKYMTSGDISGDYSSVVGYAGIVIE